MVLKEFTTADSILFDLDKEKGKKVPTTPLVLFSWEGILRRLFGCIL
jgi:hypothetical protein